MATIKRHRNVKLGRGSSVGPFAIIGMPPRGARDGQFATQIGAKAVIRSHSVIYAGNVIGDNFQTGHGVMLREMNTIGDNVSIGTGSILEHHVIVGDGVRIHSQAFVPEYTILEAGCWIGPRVVITNAKYPLSPTAKANLKGATVRRGAKVGANSTLLPGVVIGENALVGAGSVVTKDVPPGAVVAGNPARVLRSIKELPYD
ncbi:MAG: acyltransferase [Elusimicrobiota bacterium]